MSLHKNSTSTHSHISTALIEYIRQISGASLMAGLSLAILLLTVSPAIAGKPSPATGRTISFQRLNAGSQNAQLQLVRDDGSGLVAVSNSRDLWRYTRARWSPDGAMLGGYFKSLRNDFGVMAMKADGSQERVVVSDKQFNALNLARAGVLSSSLLTSRSSYPSWVGNNALVFAASTKYDAAFFGESDPRYKSNGDRLFIVDSTGTLWPLTETALANAGPLGNGNYYDGDPHYSAVLDAIVFVSNRNGYDELYAIHPDGTGLTQITNFGIRFEGQTKVLFEPVWSPQGDRVALSVNFDDGGNPRDLLILEIDLTQPTPGTGTDGRVVSVDPFQIGAPQENSPSWSPTGDRLLFHRFHFDTRLSQIVVAGVVSGAESVIAEIQLDPNSLVPDVLLPDWKPVP